MAAGLSVSCNYKNSKRNKRYTFKFDGGKVMAGLMMMVTGLMAGYGSWRGKHVGLRFNDIE